MLFQYINKQINESKKAGVLSLDKEIEAMIHNNAFLRSRLGHYIDLILAVSKVTEIEPNHTCVSASKDQTPFRCSEEVSCQFFNGQTEKT